MAKKKNTKQGIKTTIIEGIPQWAAYYLEYGESEGLCEKEVKMVKKYLDGLQKEGYRLICPKEGTENEFNSWPAFGLPCATQDWDAEVIGKEEL